MGMAIRDWRVRRLAHLSEDTVPDEFPGAVLPHESDTYARSRLRRSLDDSGVEGIYICTGYSASVTDIDDIASGETVKAIVMTAVAAVLVGGVFAPQTISEWRDPSSHRGRWCQSIAR